jgi:hypothetical protein
MIIANGGIQAELSGLPREEMIKALLANKWMI